MTMHLLPVFVTTTSTRKRRSKLTGKAGIKLEAHERWVEKMTKGAKADKRVLDKAWRAEYNDSMMVDRSAFKKSGMVPGAFPRPEEKVYSGELKLLGIATMHKSNMVPVFARQDAEDIARMRRG